MNRREFFNYALAFGAGMGVKTLLGWAPEVPPLGTPEQPQRLTKDNMAEYLAQCGRLLDEQHVPSGDRYLYVPDHLMPMWEGTVSRRSGWHLVSSNALQALREKHGVALCRLGPMTEVL